MRFVFYLIFHLRLLFQKINKFETEDSGYEKFWLAGGISIIINLNLSSIDKIFFNGYISNSYYYFFFINGFAILFIVYQLLIKREKYLYYGFKENFKGYLALIILFLITIVLMAMINPKNNH